MGLIQLKPLNCITIKLNKILIGNMNNELEVLIVDDCAITHFLHKEAIKDCLPSSILKSFINGKQVLDYLVENKNDVKKCFVLLDLNMPIMDGFSFLEKLQRANVSNKVVVAVITSSTDYADKERALKYPQVVAFLEKPFKADDFIKIEKYIYQS